jgi:hypothetical protein
MHGSQSEPNSNEQAQVSTANNQTRASFANRKRCVCVMIFYHLPEAFLADGLMNLQQ